jgi:hypothetical protein
VAPLKRRDFLLLRFDPERNSIELSCERLMMKYVDAELNGTTAQLFARLDQELRNVRELRLVDAVWLSREDFARDLEKALTMFRDRGGRVVKESA